MNTYLFRNEGTCSSAVKITVDGSKIEKVRFVGGCSGNTQGVAGLAEGRQISEVISILRGIRCGFKSTSCPDQLAQALEAIEAAAAGSTSPRLQQLEEQV